MGHGTLTIAEEDGVALALALAFALAPAFALALALALAAAIPPRSPARHEQCSHTSGRERPMLEKIPVALGYAVRRARAGAGSLTYANDAFRNVALALRVTSPAFEDERPIPARYTASGEGLSPPLAWSGVPPDARQVVLVVEDADSPTPAPLVHAIAWNLPPGPDQLSEGALQRKASAGTGTDLGRASSLRAEYVPPDPPRGRGPHHYAFEVFALDRRVVFRRPPGRRELIAAMRGHVVAKGVLVGTFERR